MTNRYAQAACALALILALPAAAFAQQRGGPERAALPQSRAAAPQKRPAPTRGRTAPAGGFNLRRDTAPAPDAQRRQTQPVAQRPPVQARPVAQAPAPQQRNFGGRSAPPAGYRTAPVGSRSGGPLAGRFNGRVIRNTRVQNGTYAWNHGVNWQPAPIYWGGGFWGPFAVADIAALTVYGWIADSRTRTIYDSYQLQPDSPGWQLLQDYQLQQTPCGPPDLVVIWGPENSVICAYPNNLVGAGDYQVDPTTFGLVTASN